MGKKALLTSTLILTVTGFITRILGFVFRIYMSNIIGAEGMGLYQLIFPIYMLTWAACSAGVSLAVSRKVAELTVKHKHQDAIRTLKCATVIAISIALGVSIIIFTFAPFIATHLIHAPDTALGLRLLAFCLPFMAIACCIRGYFQGRQEMFVSGMAQVIEQVARMIIIFLLGATFVPKGLAYACALGTLGLCVGEFCSCIFTYIMYKLKKRQLVLRKATLPYREAFSTILTISVPITCNRFLTSFLHTVENILIPLQLVRFGLSHSESLALYGMFSGMAMPLLFFPSMITGAISTALVPSVSESVATKNTRVLKQTISKSIQLSALIGIGASCLFYMLGHEIAMACYNNPQVGELLKMLAIICPFIYLQGILNGILNGLGLEKLTFKGNVIGSILCITLILTIVPTYGIVGFVIALLFQSGFITCYHLWHALKYVDLPIDIINWYLKPSLAALLGCISMKYIYYGFFINMFSPILATLVAISILGVFYITYLFLFRCVTKEDILTILR